MVSTVICIYLVLLTILNVQPIKNIGIREIENQVGHLLGSKIEIKDIEVGLFNRIVINNLKVYDYNDEILLQANKISAKVCLTDLLKNKLHLSSLLLMDSEINCYQETEDSAPNYEFVLKLLETEDETSENGLQFSIGSFVITRANLSYNKRWLQDDTQQFNPNKIAVRNLNANISIKSLKKDSVDVRVRNFSCQESKGFTIDQLRLKLKSTGDSVSVQHLLVKLPNTQIVCNDGFLITNDTANLGLKGYIDIKNFNTKDFVSFIPALKSHRYDFSGCLNCESTLNSTLIDVNLKERNNSLTTSLLCKLESKNQVHLTLNKLLIDSALVAQIASKLPENLKGISKLQTCSLHGHANVDFQKRIGGSELKLTSPTLGTFNVSTSLLYDKLNLALTAHKTNLNHLLSSDYLPEDLSFSSNFSAAVNDSLLLPENLSLHIHTAINKRLYNIRDVQANIGIQNDILNCNIRSSVPQHSIELVSNCKYTENSLSEVFVNAKIENIDFDQIGYNDTIFNGKWSGILSLQIPTLTPNKLSAALKVDSLRIDRLSSEYKLNHCSANIDYTQRNHSTLNILSDAISVNAEGTIDHSTLIDAWKSTIIGHAPNLMLSDKSTKNNGDKTSMSFFVNVHDGTFLKKLLQIPVEMSNGTIIQGKLHKGDTHSEMSAHFAELRYQDTELENVSLHLKSKELGAGLLLQGRKEFLNDKVQFVLGAQLHDNLLESNLEWDGINQHKLSGSLNTITSFLETDCIQTSVLPTSIHLEDSVWHVSHGTISLIDNEPSIDNLTINTDYQKITINGGISSVKQDSLILSLENINIGDILDKVDFRSVLFDGEASGFAKISISPNQPFLQTNLQVKSFLFNNTLLGNANISGFSEEKLDKIDIKGEFIENGVGYTRANGHVSPSENKIDLRITTKETNIEFLKYWVDHIVKDIKGRTTGFCRLYGPFNNLDLSGSMRLNASLHVPSNGVDYALNDAKMLISSGLLDLQNATIISPKGGFGQVQAKLYHNHLKNFSYNLNLSSENLLLYDKARSTDMPFYATTYATGNVTLQGNPSHLNLFVDVSPTDNSMIVYTESEVASINESTDGFVTYRNAVKEESINLTIPAFSVIHNPGLDMNMRFNINMNPSLTLRVLMDEVTGDFLDLRGNGVLSANYYNKGTFQLYGNYDIIGGNYHLSIQDLLKKNLDIQSGSSIVFGGNPDDAQLKIKAVYTVPTASLADLNIGDSFSDRNIRANCILNIGGTASNPNVNFDLDLPNINDDEKQMVRKLIATEDDLNMQVIHLLALGRFYTYDYALSQSYQKQSQSTVAANSFLSSTLSSQINEVITSALGTEDWSFGTNLSTGTSGWSDMEVDGIISGKLFNNRLHLNGNVGYHENEYNAMRGSNFVGDFDAKYLLNRNGSIFLKAYSETNDRYFTKSALTTQGFGILFQKDFYSIKELFPRKNKKKQVQ